MARRGRLGRCAPRGSIPASTASESHTVRAAAASAASVRLAQRVALPWNFRLSDSLRRPRGGTFSDLETPAWERAAAVRRFGRRSLARQQCSAAAGSTGHAHETILRMRQPAAPGNRLAWWHAWRESVVAIGPRGTGSRHRPCVRSSQRCLFGGRACGANRASG